MRKLRWGDGPDPQKLALSSNCLAPALGFAFGLASAEQQRRVTATPVNAVRKCPENAYEECVMAVAPEPIQPPNLQEQWARIDKTQAQLQKMMWELMIEPRLEPQQMFLRGALVTATLIGAGAVLAK